MITCDTITKCAYLSTTRLEEILRKNYPKDKVLQSYFIGITNGGQFCYDISYPDDNSKTGLSRGKVFVSLDITGNLTAEY